MKNKREFVLISSITIIVVCIIGVALYFLVRANASYIWVMDKGTSLNETYLVKMCSNGTKILKVQFGQSGAIGIDQRSGSVWAPELNDRGGINVDQVVKIDAYGNIIRRYRGYRTSVIAVDPNNGSVWVGLPNEGQVVKLNSNGEIVLRVEGFSFPASIAVDPRDSSIWVADGQPTPSLVHLAANGIELFSVKTVGFFSNAPHQIAVDPLNGDVWYTGFHMESVYKLSSTGRPLATIGVFDRPVSVSIHPSDGGVWVADYSLETSGSVVRLDSDAKTIRRVVLDNPPHIAAVNPVDGTLWVGTDGAMLKLSDDGEILKKITGFTIPKSIAFIRSEDDIMAKIVYFITCLGYP